ncbi:MAG: right-handed parallel beta-helix repeat-containing protein, partial [Candidatus Binatia bacterium]
MSTLGGLGMKARLVGLVAAWLFAVAVPGVAHAATRLVNNSGTCVDVTPCTVVPCCTIQFAIGVSINNDVINVAAGTYGENVTLNKNVFLRGAQFNIPACDRVDTETIIAPTSGVGLTLVTGSASATIDGFTFSGGTRGIGAVDSLSRLKIQNNRFVGFTDSGAFFAAGAPAMDFFANSIDGSSASGVTGLFHLDGNNDYDALEFRDSCVFNGTGTCGFFVDGDHNVGNSVDGGNPAIEDSRFENNSIGACFGSQSVDQMSIARNTFSDNAIDGLQGGMQNSSIDGNTMSGNGRYGLLLTSFGNSNPATGAQDNDITNNCISGNGLADSGAGIFYSDAQAAGTIATNVASGNNIYGNFAGAVYDGGETIDAQGNWWGCATGANTATCDTASATIDTSSFLTDPSVDAPCDPLA